MPGYDKTGPLGQGPRTGRGLGRCAGARRGRKFWKDSYEEIPEEFSERLDRIEEMLEKLTKEKK